jgi:hypothetical protein
MCKLSFIHLANENSSIVSLILLFSHILCVNYVCHLLDRSTLCRFNTFTIYTCIPTYICSYIPIYYISIYNHASCLRTSPPCLISILNLHIKTIIAMACVILLFHLPSPLVLCTTSSYFLGQIS